MKNRRIFVSVIAIILVIMMIVSLVVTVIPAMADGTAASGEPVSTEAYTAVQQKDK